MLFSMPGSEDAFGPRVAGSDSEPAHAGLSRLAAIDQFKAADSLPSLAQLLPTIESFVCPLDEVIVTRNCPPVPAVSHIEPPPLYVAHCSFLI